jgi:hypothetical protein
MGKNKKSAILEGKQSNKIKETNRLRAEGETECKD